MNNLGSQEPSIICKEFPLILHNEDFTIWEGHLLVEVNQFKIKIFVPFYPLMMDTSFECSPYIKSCLQSHIDNLKKCKTLLSFVYCIIHIVKSKFAVATSLMELWNGNMVKLSHTILMELEKSLPKGNNIIEIKESFKTIKLKYDDIDGNEHFLLFNVTPEYPKGNINILEVDLPLEALGTLSKVNTIGQLYDLFKQSVDSLVPFWKMCKILDEKSWVVEPSKPQKRDVYRRILLSEYLSVVLTFNPLDLSSYPDVKFLGSMKAVAEGKENYIKNLEMYGWNEEDVADNLTHLFEIKKLPVKLSTYKAVDNENECYICFMSTIENEEPPSKWCNNPQCSSWYHHSCLIQWLQMVVSCAELSDHISGTCPYCGEKLWCQLRQNNQ